MLRVTEEPGRELSAEWRDRRSRRRGARRRGLIDGTLARRPAAARGLDDAAEIERRTAIMRRAKYCWMRLGNGISLPPRMACAVDLEGGSP